MNISQDPLGLASHPTAQSIRIARITPRSDVVQIMERITNPAYADAVEVKVLLLAHLIFKAYLDIKGTFAK